MTDLYEPDLIDYDAPPEELDDSHALALDRASWHVRKIAEARFELDRLDAVYSSELRRLEKRREMLASTIASRIEWHSAPVLALHAALVAADPRRKTIQLPHGVMKASVPTKARIFIADPVAVQDWALEHMPDACPPKQVLVTALRNVLVVGADLKVTDPATGEVVPGLSASVPEPSFSVDTDLGDF